MGFPFFFLPHQTKNPVMGKLAQIKLDINAKIFPKVPKIAPT